VKSVTNHPDRVDDKLIEKARTGDEQAFVMLMRKYEQTVYSYSFNVCRDKEKAAETLQDTFVNVFQKLEQFNRKSKFSTWLYSIVTNNCLMKRRRSTLSKALVNFEEYADHSIADRAVWPVTPLDETLKKELRDHLDRAILKMPLEYRITFVLRDVEGKPADEVAEILKISVPAVKSRLRRARVFLREQLEGYRAS
jgi:RNA polymerase sigma-70 factor (ECF subfamily)